MKEDWLQIEEDRRFIEGETIKAIIRERLRTMKRKLILGVSVLILLSGIFGYVCWQQYENSRLQPYYKLYYAIENQCQATVGSAGYYKRQTSRDNGKRVKGYGLIFLNTEKYQLKFAMQDDEYRIAFYKGFSQQIFDGETEILDAPGYYEYVYDKVSNKIEESSIGSTKIAYPPQSLISAFEQEMIERLKSC